MFGFVEGGGEGGWRWRMDAGVYGREDVGGGVVAAEVSGGG